MKVIVKRIFNCPTYCISHIYVDDKYICDGIEDMDRMLDQNMEVKQILKIKVPNKTAIPIGKYKLTLNIESPTFKKYKYYTDFCKAKLPRVLNVPGWDGILIHRGVDEKNSAGCLIVGYNKIKGKVINSQEAFEKLYNILKTANNKGENIYIEYTRTY